MPAEKRVFVGSELDDAAELPPVFGGITGGEQAQGFNGIGIHIRGKSGRAILHQRLAIDDELHVVFGAARMQHAVAFVEPAGLLIDKIEEVAARLEAELLANRLLADGIECARARGVHEREFVGDLDLGGEGRDAEGDAEFHGDFGVDFDDVAPGGETFRGEIQAVDAERKVMENVVAVCRNLEAALEAVAFAEEFATGGEAGAFRIADFKMEFAAQALRARRASRGEAEKAGQEGEAIDKDLGPFTVHCKKAYVIPGV